MIGYFLDDNGYIKYIDFVDEKAKGNFTTVKLPNSLKKPKFNGTDWVDGMTDDEFKKANSSSNLVDSTQKQLALFSQQFAALKQENAALQKMVIAQNDRISKLGGTNSNDDTK